MISANKLSKFDRQLTPTEQKYLSIIPNLGKVFVLSQNGVANLAKFFQECKLECVLQLDGIHREAVVKSIKNKLQESEFNKSANPADSLPFHLVDYGWLAQLTASTVKKHNPEFNCSPTEVRYFFKVFPDFSLARMDYIKKLVKELIIHTTVEKPENATYSINPKRKQMYEYDEVFRNKLLLMMEVLGVPHSISELFIETNADLWRNQNMVRMFEEHYNHNQKMNSSESYERYRDIFVKCREKHYYDKHSAIVKKSKTLTKNMQMGQVEYFYLINKLNHYNLKYLKDHNDNLQTKEEK